MVFHLQQQAPPILPPIYLLFGDSWEQADEACLPPWELDTVERAVELARARFAAFRSWGEANASSLDELLAGFFERFCQLLGGRAGATG